MLSYIWHFIHQSYNFVFKDFHKFVGLTISHNLFVKLGKLRLLVVWMVYSIIKIKYMQQLVCLCYLITGGEGFCLILIPKYHDFKRLVIQHY